MCLFGTIIPFDYLTSFYDKFIDKGWVYFNTLLVEFLKELQPALMQFTDNTEVLQFLKDLNLSKSSSESMINKLNWAFLIESAYRNC